MLSEEELRDASLLVFANKQDQPGAKGAGEISEALSLAELKDRNWSIVGCSAIDGRGVSEGMDWLVVSSASFTGDEAMANTKTANGGRGEFVRAREHMCNLVHTPICMYVELGRLHYQGAQMYRWFWHRRKSYS